MTELEQLQHDVIRLTKELLEIRKVLDAQTIVLASFIKERHAQQFVMRITNTEKLVFVIMLALMASGLIFVLGNLYSYIMG